MEHSSSELFKPPTTLLRNVPIAAVKLPTGTISTDPKVIHEHFRAHWGTSFGDPSYPTDHTSICPDNQNKLIESIENKIGNESKDLLDAVVTIEELTESIKHMRRSSAPGPDGLTAGFYQVAPEGFAAILNRVFQYLERSILLPSQLKSSVCLLPKKGERHDPGNYRPISLMQVDVKILSKALAYRLQQVLPSIIHTDQKGFVKGRSLHHQVRLLADLQHIAMRNNTTALDLFLDFEKHMTASTGSICFES
ncbi:Pol Polyprotein [Phytophthora megakarya]|uniref:Pol Polyprotein n=1 Tax=Phytophthora megakarya TaxID=4795 RepID=A0A225V3C3_9STRA|nr:Pol Polyprotein [Phytophthora megakarya]